MFPLEKADAANVLISSMVKLGCWVAKREAPRPFRKARVWAISKAFVVGSFEAATESASTTGRTNSLSSCRANRAPVTNDARTSTKYSLQFRNIH
jgi:hypothetical protein